MEIVAQVSGGLLGLTKLRAKGITEVRKMRGEYNGDQVEGHKSEEAGDSMLHAHQNQTNTDSRTKNELLN